MANKIHLLVVNPAAYFHLTDSSRSRRKSLQTKLINCLVYLLHLAPTQFGKLCNEVAVGETYIRFLILFAIQSKIKLDTKCQRNCILSKVHINYVYSILKVCVISFLSEVRVLELKL